MHVMNALWLPSSSTGPRGGLLSNRRATHEAIRRAGFDGAQIQPPFGSVRACRAAGLRHSGAGTFGKLPFEPDLAVEARKWKDQGYECATLLVGTGLESDAEAARRVERVLDVATKTDFPLYVETHRATVTQDPRRTLELIGRFPELRFNGDFSHWYTGFAMAEGDVEATLERLDPVFERTRFLQARIGTNGRIQAPIGDARSPAVNHFREMWTRCFVAFLRHAAAGESIWFATELLPSWQGYAPVRRTANASGSGTERGDRWADAIVLGGLARECFGEAKKRVGRERAP
jgi:hypothetical protein